MPRILPRLLERINKNPATGFDRFDIRPLRPRRTSLYRPPPTRPSFDPSLYPRSIILSPGNPITDSWNHEQHKRLPPRVFVRERDIKAHKRKKGNAYDLPRPMSEEELSWFASPYLRMLASPLRKDVTTERYVPTDFLVRLGLMKVPSPRTSGRYTVVLIPDGVEHTKFKVRRSGRATYILCWKHAVDQMDKYNRYHRVLPTGVIHEQLAEQIGHLLRLRVLQELELLFDRLRRVPKALFHTPIIRKLSRDEWTCIQTHCLIPYDNAVAVLVVPPVNRHPETKVRPEGSMSSQPPVIDTSVLPRGPRLPPSVLMPVSRTTESMSDVPDHPQPRVPLYNGVPLFPDRHQRASLHRLLSQLVAHEADMKYRFGGADDRPARVSPIDDPRPVAQTKLKASHAYLLCSDTNTMRRADVAAVAIALWRLRLYEGADWKDSAGWVKRRKYRSVDVWE